MATLELECLATKTRGHTTHECYMPRASTRRLCGFARARRHTQTHTRTHTQAQALQKGEREREMGMSIQTATCNCNGAERASRHLSGLFAFDYAKRVRVHVWAIMTLCNRRRPANDSWWLGYHITASKYAFLIGRILWYTSKCKRT